MKTVILTSAGFPPHHCALFPPCKRARGSWSLTRRANDSSDTASEASPRAFSPLARGAEGR